MNHQNHSNNAKIYKDIIFLLPAFIFAKKIDEQRWFFHYFIHTATTAIAKITKQMIINNLSAISHVFKTSYTPILHVFETSNIPIFHVFEVLAKKLGQKKSSIERAVMAHARCLSLL